MKRHDLLFDDDTQWPVFVCEQQGQWAAESLMTGTISVRGSREEAMKELARLLDGEIQDALAEAEDAQQALASLYCEPRMDLLVAYMSLRSQAAEDLAAITPRSGARLVVRQSRVA